MEEVIDLNSNTGPKISVTIQHSQSFGAALRTAQVQSKQPEEYLFFLEQDSVLLLLKRLGIVEG